MRKSRLAAAGKEESATVSSVRETSRSRVPRANKSTGARNDLAAPGQSVDPVLAQLAGLKTATTPQLKDQWRSLFGTEPPRYNRRFLESRLAYRVQELAYGGLRPETIRRLEKLGEEIEQERLKGGRGKGRKSPLDNRPIAGTRLIREWKGVEHTVIVRQDSYEWEGRPFKSLSPIAFAITGTRWNGWTFFGLKNQKQSGSRA